MMFRYLDIRTNPGYKYDVVLGDINYNFSLLTGVTSALTSGAFLSLSGGTVSGTTIFSGNGTNEILVIRNPDTFPSGQDSFQVWDGSNTKQLFIDSSNQFAFNAGTNGPLYFGTFANPSAGLGGFSAPNQVINNYSVNTIRMGVGGSGSYFAINDPKALFEARGKADEIQLIVQANSTQNQNIIEVRDASENPFAIVNTTGITSNLSLIVSGANMAIQNALGMLELGENGQVEKSNVQQIQGSVQFTANAFYNGAWNQYNPAIPSWNMYLTPDLNDSMVVRRSAPSGISWVELFKIDGTGVIYSAGTSLYDIFLTSNTGITGSGTANFLPVFNGTNSLTNSILQQSTATGLTVFGSVEIYGNVDIAGTASTFNTQTVQTKDNNISMNLSGSHVSALYGGITVLSGTPNNGNSTWTIDANGSWSSNTLIQTSALTVNGGALVVSGDTTLQGLTAITAVFGPSTSSSPAFIIQSGSTPTSRNDGYFWFDNASGITSYVKNANIPHTTWTNGFHAFSIYHDATGATIPLGIGTFTNSNFGIFTNFGINIMAFTTANTISVGKPNFSSYNVPAGLFELRPQSNSSANSVFVIRNSNDTTNLFSISDTGNVRATAVTATTLSATTISAATGAIQGSLFLNDDINQASNPDLIISTIYNGRIIHNDANTNNKWYLQTQAFGGGAGYGNFGIGTSSNNANNFLTIGTGGTTNITRLGVNTNVPIERFGVNGNAYINGGLTANTFSASTMLAGNSVQALSVIFTPTLQANLIYPTAGNQNLTISTRVGAGGSTDIIFNSSGTTPTETARFTSSGTTKLTSNSISGFTIYNATGATPTFIVNTSANTVGNVGIRVSSPIFPFEVSGGSNSHIVGKLWGDSSRGASLQFTRAASYDWSIGAGGSTGVVPASSFGVYDTTANALRMIFTHTNGLVGINTSAPRERLEVNGNAYINGSLTGATISSTTISSTTIYADSFTGRTLNLSNNDGGVRGLDSTGLLRTLLSFNSSDNILINGRLGTTDIILNPTSGGIGLYVKGQSGNIGAGVASPSAGLHIRAGTVGSSGAPLKFTSGVTQTIPESGATEYDGTSLFFTPTGTSRFKLFINGYFEPLSASTITTGGFTSSTNSISGFSVVNLSSNTAVLTVDTINNRVGVLRGNPATALDVGGAINALSSIGQTGGYYIGTNNIIEQGPAGYSNGAMVFGTRANTFQNVWTEMPFGISTSGGTLKNLFTIAQAVAGYGRISSTSGLTTITGANTSFISFFNTGDTITFASNTYTISAITSDTLLVLNTTAATTSASVNYTTAAAGDRLYVGANGNVKSMSNSVSGFTVYAKTGTTSVFSVDTANFRVGINTDAPAYRWHLKNGSAGSVSLIGGTNAAIENSTTNYMTFIQPDANVGGVTWGSPSDPFGAYVRWGFTQNQLDISTSTAGGVLNFQAGTDVPVMTMSSTQINLFTNNLQRGVLNSTGKFGLGTTAPTEQLHVTGNTLIGGGLTGSSAVISGNTRIADGILFVSRLQDASLSMMSVNVGTANTNAFQLNVDQPNSKSILDARNGYNLSFQISDAEKAILTANDFKFFVPISAGTISANTMVTSSFVTSNLTANTISNGTQSLTGFQTNLTGMTKISGLTVAGQFIDFDGTQTNAYLRNSVGNLRLTNGGSGADIIFDSNGTNSATLRVRNTDLQFSNGFNITISTGATGTKIGTANSQLFAFWNATPIVQPVSGTSLDVVLTNTGLMQSGATYNSFSLPLSATSLTASSLSLFGDILFSGGTRSIGTLDSGGLQFKTGNAVRGGFNAGSTVGFWVGFSPASFPGLLDITNATKNIGGGIGTKGFGISQLACTFTDAVSTGGTVARMYGDYFGIKTFAALSSVTYSEIYGTYLEQPVTGSNVTANSIITIGVAGNVAISGNTTLGVAGNKMIIATGTNASAGVVILTAGTATVSNTLVTNSSMIFLTPQNYPVGGGGSPVPAVAVSGRTAGVSFTIASSDAGDTATIAWQIIEPK